MILNCKVISLMKKKKKIYGGTTRVLDNMVAPKSQSLKLLILSPK